MKPVAHLHKTIADRRAAAKRLIAETETFGEVICDSMRDDALERYFAFPDGISVVLDGVLVHDGGPVDEWGIKYNVESVTKWLEERYTDNNKKAEDISPVDDSDEADEVPLLSARKRGCKT
jgi:hypothetical protein